MAVRVGTGYLGLLVLTACAFEPPPVDVPPAFELPGPPPAEVEFGDGGLVVLDDLMVPQAHEYGRALAMLPNGGIAVSVLIATDSELDSAIVRLSNTGALMGSSMYGTTGDDYFEGLAADPDGAIYAVGASVYSDVQAVLPVVKYRSDGELDGDFGVDGHVFLPALIDRCTDEARRYQVAFSVSLDRDMRLLISGNATEDDCVDRDMIVARLDRTSGELDTTFGNAGVVSTRAPVSDMTSQSDNGQDVLALPDGRIVVVGNTNRTGDFNTADAVLWIHGEDGAEEMAGVFPDLDGNGSGSDSFRAVTTDAAGRLLVAGRSYNGTDYDAVVVRFDASGQLDPTFGKDGVFLLSSRRDDWARGIAVDASGRILIAGYVTDGTNEDLVVWAVTPDGARDADWGKGGIATHDFGRNERAEAIAFDDRGRAFVTGSIQRPNGTWAALVLRVSP